MTNFPKQYLDILRRELAQVEDSLARPVEEGRMWNRRRALLMRQADALRARINRAIYRAQIGKGV